MALKVNTKLLPVDYIPNIERDDPNPTVFTLKPLNGAEYLDVIAYMTNADGVQRLSRAGIEKIFAYGVRNVSNVIDQDGQLVKKATADLFDPIILSEIAGEILSISEIGDSEKKISSSQ